MSIENEINSAELLTSVEDKYRRAINFIYKEEFSKAEELLDYSLIQLAHFTEQAARQQVEVEGISFYEAAIDKIPFEKYTLGRWKQRVWTLLDKIGAIPE